MCVEIDTLVDTRKSMKIHLFFFTVTISFIFSTKMIDGDFWKKTLSGLTHL